MSGNDSGDTMRAERRIVTVLVVDIVESTALTENLDPEDARELVGGALSVVIEKVDALGGTVKDLAGDGVLALFGAPVAHEDDAERAVLCGLRVIEAIADYAQVVADRWHVEDFAVRVGIETGPAVLGPLGAGSRVEYGAVGDAVVTAARLQSHAEPGTVLAGAATRAMVENRFMWGSPRPLELKGKRGPVEASPVLSYAPGRLRDVSPFGAPLVGRVDELARVTRALDDLRKGHGRVVLIGGEPGVGKSRLIAELQRQFMATSAGQWLEGAAVSYAVAVPYLPYRHLLLHWLGCPVEAGRGKVLSALEQRAANLAQPAGDALRRILPALAPGTGDRVAAPEEIQQRTFRAVGKLFDELAVASPLVLVLEDLHWSDATSLALTEHLASTITLRPILLLLAVRGETAWRRLTDRLTRSNPDTILPIYLFPLEPGADKALLNSLLGGAVLPHGLERRLLDAGQGNPLFLEEQVRSLIAAGAVELDQSGWRFVADTPLQLAPTIERALVARIDQLDPAVRDVLLAASVLGPHFRLSLLDALLGRNTPETLAGLADDYLLPDGRIDDDGGAYRFRHALVQEAAYRCLLRRQRVELHARAAAALAADYAGREDEIAANLGRHLAAAGDYDRAAKHMLAAVRQATAAFANEEAAALAQEALTLIDARTDDLADAHRSIARDLFRTRAVALHHLSRHDEMVEALGQALALTPADDVLGIAEMHTLMGVSFRDAHRFDDAMTEFDIAERCIGKKFRTRDGFARWLDLQLGRGGVLYWQGNVDGYTQLLQQVEPYIDELATDEQRLLFYDSARAVLWRRDRYQVSDETIRLDGIAYQASEASRDPVVRAWGTFYHGLTLMWHGDIEDAGRMFRESNRASEQLADSLLLSRSVTYRLVVARLQGDVRSATDLIAPVIDAARQARLPEYEALVAATEAWIAYRCGDADRTMSQGQNALDQWTSLPNRYFFDWMACLPLVSVALTRDELAAASDLAGLMLDETQQRLPAQLEECLSAAIHATEIGDPSVARSKLEEAVTIARDLHWL